MRYKTVSGPYVTAATRAAATALAAQYGFGALVGAAPVPAKPRQPMSLTTAHRLASEADDWPRCGQNWPANARECEAARLVSEADEQDD